MIDRYEQKREKEKMVILQKQLPERCKNCGMLEIINLNKGLVRCFYLIKDKCMLKERK